MVAVSESRRVTELKKKKNTNNNNKNEQSMFCDSENRHDSRNSVHEPPNERTKSIEMVGVEGMERVRLHRTEKRY